MNEFSILCRVLGTLYYRQPQDPLLVPLFTLIREGKLAQSWPLEQDELLERLQKLRYAADFNGLQRAVCGEECRVSPYRSARQEGATEAEVRAFFRTRHAADGYACRSYRYPAGGLLGLKIMQVMMRTRRLRPCSKRICCRGLAPSGKVEAHATSPFWRTLAPLTRDAIAAMWDELEEENEE